MADGTAGRRLTAPAILAMKGNTKIKMVTAYDAPTARIANRAGADVILVGEGQSDLEGDLKSAAAQQSRVVTPENLPENGLFFRADHFSVARRGVPVLLIMGIAGGSDLVEGGRAAGDQWIADYIGNCYHQPCDVWDPDWDLRGATQDIELFHTIVRDLGNSRRWPQWKEGSEFKAIREKSTKSRK